MWDERVFWSMVDVNGGISGTYRAKAVVLFEHKSRRQMIVSASTNLDCRRLEVTTASTRSLQAGRKSIGRSTQAPPTVTGAPILHNFFASFCNRTLTVPETTVYYVCSACFRLIAMTSTLSRLKATLPCRSAQIEQLYNLFGYKGEPFPDSIYISGGPSVGKSIVVTTVLQKLCVKYAVINLIECYTTKILFESILSKLCGLVDAKCDNMMDFIDNLQRNRSEIAGSVLIIDKAEKLRTMDFNLFPGFLKLRELTGIPISVIFLSEIILQKYYSKANIDEPIQITFRQYNKEELLEILSLDIDYARCLIMNNTPNGSFQFDLDFYQNYLNLFLSVFYRNCRDLSELRYIARTNFLNYCQPIINKENTIQDSMTLWRKIAPILKQALQNLYLRTANEQQTTPTKDNLAQSLELPFYAKYLLIAAYLASYNSTKDDKRLFMKYHGKKTKTTRDVNKKSKVSEQLNTLLGPKPFTFDRLLAIFYSILDDRVGFNNNLLVQVSSLVELQLLSSLSDSSNLDSPKYKCNVNFDFIQTVSKMVGFNIRKYLSDFSHL
ncbi:origin recognition complex subunit 5 [Asbolus verrucosus]|uniref:Origin recognition complex subunit 5 n=1 Tax=Asbolus verrucosus TaxID=1661398 RepID=A0A482VET4_ASBVE|nr:origin recognition complex subunit 5 [Asbolus verrucosus]